MLHYRLTQLNNRSRMLIATFLAIALHIGLVNFANNPRPLLVPSISLPRSVSVFLDQRNMVEAPVMQTEKTQTAEYVFEEQPAAERDSGKAVSQKSPSVQGKTDNPLQQPVSREEAVKQPVVEKIIPAAQYSEDSEKVVMPEPGEAAKVQESAIAAEPQAAGENAGAALPGVLQMAYPRYQLNIPPAYPGLARKRGQEGTVILQVLVSKEGRVDELKIANSSGFGLLDRAALGAVQKWLFEPGQRDEKKVGMWVKVPVTFKLK